MSVFHTSLQSKIIPSRIFFTPEESRNVSPTFARSVWERSEIATLSRISVAILLKPAIVQVPQKYRTAK